MNDASADPGISGRLVSGEAVELDVRVARLGSRLLAFLFDIGILIVAFLLVAGIGVSLLTALVGLIFGLQAVDAALTTSFYTIALVLVFVLVPATVETLCKGKSLGKLVMGLRVVRDDGGPIRFRHSLIRSLTAFAVEFPGLLMPGLTWFAALGVMLFHPSGKRIGDLSAGTIVIHERTPYARNWAPVMPAGLGAWAATADLTALDDDLALAIRHFLARNHDIAEPVRTQLGRSLATELAAHVSPPPPVGAPGWAVLAAVLAERHRRAGARLAANRAVTAQVWDTLYGASRGQAAWIQGSPWQQPPTSVPQVPTGRLFVQLSRTCPAHKSCVADATFPQFTVR